MLKRINQDFYLIAAIILAVFGGIFMHRVSGGTARVTDIAGLIVCTSFFCMSVIVGYLEGLGRKLEKWLEPKTGGALGSSAVTEQFRNRSNLEHSLVHALAPYLVNISKADALGNYIRDAADAILGCTSKPALNQPSSSGVAMCSCSLKGSCSGCKSAGAIADQAAEDEIVAAELTAPRVTAAEIQALMDKLTWRYDQPEGTTSTFAHAFLGRFYLATGHSACVSPENFNVSLGMKYAREQAEGKARDKLWELEGYKLASQLQEK